MSLTVAFDVDDTLIDADDNPRPGVVKLAKALLYAGHDVIVWSGGGRQYAEMWANRLGLEEAFCVGKFEGAYHFEVDVAFDDEKDTLLAEQMFVVGRSRNSA